MPTTYSINVGTLIEATRKTDIFKVLQDLPDNTQKLISPRDVRDAFLTTWANSSFKITTPGALATEYIGLDSGDPSNRDIKQKILLGKRSVGNLDVMNNTLLSSNVSDIFLYNTKSDSVSQASTKVSILSGTNSLLHQYAPYFEAFATASVIDFNIRNPSLGGGAINIVSSAGRVAINGIVFPTVAETIANAQNGRILKYAGTYPNGYLIWADPTLTLTSIGSPTMSTDLWGSPVTVNGISLEFTDDSIVPVNVGGLTAGMSFSSDSFYNPFLGTYSDWPVTEIIRKILYPYIPPVLQLSVSNNGSKYMEAGATATLTFTYSITSYARNSTEWIRDFVIKTPTQTHPNMLHYGFSFSGVAGATLSNSFQFATNSSVGTLNFELHISTQSSPFATASAFPFGYGLTASDSMQVVNPILFGYSPVSPAISGTALADVNQVLSSMTKTILPYPGTGKTLTLNATGSGYLYFMYPSTFATDPVRVLDPNDYVIHDSGLYIYDHFYGSQLYTPPQTLFNNIVRSTLVDSSGRVYVIGDFTSYSSNTSKYIARLNSNGNYDSTYLASRGSDGSIHTGTTASFNSAPLAFVKQSDDKIIVIGNFTSFRNVSVTRIVRINTDGSRDTSFSSSSINANFSTTYPIKNFIIHDSGSTWIVGSFTNRIVKLQSSGLVDATFNVGAGIGTITPWCLHRQSDGKIIVGGSSGLGQYASFPVGNVFRINSNGTRDTGFNSAPYFANGDIFVIKQQSDGKVIIAGKYTQFAAQTQYSISRLTSTGVLDTTFISPFSATSNAEIYDMSVQSDNKIIIVGKFTIQSGTTILAQNIARLNPNGSIDLSFGKLGTKFPSAVDSSPSYVSSITKESTDNLIIGGKFVSYGTSSVAPIDPTLKRQYIARLQSDGVLFKPSINSFFAATASTWLFGNAISANPYSGTYKVFVAKEPSSYFANASFEFIF
jgi:uncharacterized delta-60 repeat protein